MCGGEEHKPKGDRSCFGVGSAGMAYPSFGVALGGVFVLMEDLHYEWNLRLSG
jgi:hypothetical protein